MQSKNKDVLFSVSFDRWQKYQEFKRHLRGERRPEIFPIIGSSGETKTLVYAQKSDREIARIYDIQGLAPTLHHLKTGGWQEPKIAIDMTRREKDGYRIRDDNRASTLDANYHKGLANQERPAVLDNSKIRRLTPTECARLQGFPDNWCEGLSDTQQYKCYGNAVTTNVIEYIASNLVNYL